METKQDKMDNILARYLSELQERKSSYEIYGRCISLTDFAHFLPKTTV